MDLKEQAIEAIFESGFKYEGVDDLLSHFLEQAEFGGYLTTNTFYFMSYKLQFYFKQLNDDSLAFIAITKRINA